MLYQQLLLYVPGREVREQMFNEVTSLLHDLDMGMLPISVLLPYLPIPAHNRRDKYALCIAQHARPCVSMHVPI